MPKSELLLPIPQVAEQLTGKRPSPATTWRWLRKGCRGVRLNARFHGGQWLTTVSDFERFIAEQTAAQLAATSGGVSDTELADAGLL